MILGAPAALAAIINNIVVKPLLARRHDVAERWRLHTTGHGHLLAKTRVHLPKRVLSAEASRHRRLHLTLRHIFTQHLATKVTDQGASSVILRLLHLLLLHHVGHLLLLLLLLWHSKHRLTAHLLLAFRPTKIVRVVDELHVDESWLLLASEIVDRHPTEDLLIAHLAHLRDKVYGWETRLLLLLLLLCWDLDERLLLHAAVHVLLRRAVLKGVRGRRHAPIILANRRHGAFRFLGVAATTARPASAPKRTLVRSGGNIQNPTGLVYIHCVRSNAPSIHSLGEVRYYWHASKTISRVLTLIVFDRPNLNAA